MDQVQEQLRRIADELEIRNAVARLAHLADVDSDDLEAYLSLWAPDGVSVHPHWEAHGHDGLRRSVAELRRNGVQGPGTNVMHVNTTLVVAFEGNDQATAESYWQYWDAKVDPPRCGPTGRYRDTFVRTDDGWKLQRRVVTYGSEG